jgi:hypothetical protein
MQYTSEKWEIIAKFLYNTSRDKTTWKLYEEKQFEIRTPYYFRNARPRVLM